MSFTDFLEEYRGVYVCKTIDPSWSKITVQGKWEGKSAGGAPNPNCEDITQHNPQYLLKVSKPTHLLIQLSQEDPRIRGRDAYEIGILICDKKGRRVKTLFAGDLAASSLPFSNRRNGIDVCSVCHHLISAKQCRLIQR